MSLELLCSNQRNPWATIYAEELDVAGLVDMRDGVAIAELAVSGQSNFGNNVTIDTPAKLIVQSGALIEMEGLSTINFTEPDVGNQRVTGNDLFTATFTPVANSKSEGNLTVEFQEFGGMIMCRAVIGQFNMLAVPVDSVLRWEFTAGLPPRYRASESESCPVELGSGFVGEIGSLTITGGAFPEIQLARNSANNFGEFAAADTSGIDTAYRVNLCYFV